MKISLPTSAVVFSPVAAKDIAKLRGLEAGVPYLPSLPAPAPVLERIRAAMREAGVI